MILAVGNIQLQLGDRLSRGTKLDGDRLSRGTKLAGDHLSMGTEFFGTICPGGPEVRGTGCPGGPNVWGQDVGDRKSGDQMGSGPIALQPCHLIYAFYTTNC